MSNLDVLLVQLAEALQLSLEELKRSSKNEMLIKKVNNVLLKYDSFNESFEDDVVFEFEHILTKNKEGQFVLQYKFHEDGMSELGDNFINIIFEGNDIKEIEHIGEICFKGCSLQETYDIFMDYQQETLQSYKTYIKEMKPYYSFVQPEFYQNVSYNYEEETGDLSVLFILANNNIRFQYFLDTEDQEYLVANLPNQNHDLHIDFETLPNFFGFIDAVLSEINQQVFEPSEDEDEEIAKEQLLQDNDE